MLDPDALSYSDDAITRDKHGGARDARRAGRAKGRAMTMNGGEYFDRQGNPLAMMDWARRLEDRAYQRVAETTLPNGRWVSTVWIGLNHAFGDGPPMIFESMVFSSKAAGSDLDCERYSTEADARAGHEKLVTKWTQETPPEGVPS